MFVFEYSNAWADLLTQQMEIRLRGDPDNWGYACLCIGRKLDDFIERNYAAVDRISGDFLHVFSLRPPPTSFLNDRIFEAQRLGNVELAEDLLQMVRLGPKDRGQQVREKANLLQDLRNCGMRPDQYADFLFFDLQLVQETYNIDVIAAKVAPSIADEVALWGFFKNLAEVAESNAAHGKTAEQFVKGATWSWDLKVSLQRTSKLSKYILDFTTRVLRK
jgi:hypothetical protein